MKRQAITYQIVFLCLAVCCVFIQNARAGNLPFKNYTTAEGLAHDRVNRIVRDSRGFLWFCTGEGLSRFDGYEFKNYTQAHGLPHRNIYDLLEISDGIYLVATSDGMTVFNPKGAANPQSNALPMFRAFHPADVKPDKKSSVIMDLHKDRNGNLWAATMDGFYRLEAVGDEWKFNRVETELWGNTLYEFVAILDDRFGAFWLGTSNGLFRLQSNGEVAPLMQKTGILGLIEDREGRIWASTGASDTGGLNVYTFPEGKTEPVLTRTFTTKDGLTKNFWLNALLETSDGRLMVGAANSLIEYLPAAAESEPKFRALIQKDIVSLAEDAAGSIWIGTANNGALKLVRHGFVLFDEKDGVKGTINSVIGGEGNEIFASADANKILRFDGESFSAVKPFGMDSRSWGWNQIDFRARSGEWWFTTRDGILRYPPVARFEDLARTPPRNFYTTNDGLLTNEVFRLYEDSRGDVWISSLGGVGEENVSLRRWERASEKIHVYKTADGIPSGSSPTAFAEDAAGNVWIGFYYGGVARYRNGKFRFFPVQEGFPKGLINAIHADAGGRVWIATNTSGVVRVDNPTEDEPRFVALTVADGISSNQAGCVTEDGFGRIYIGTGRGITRLEPETSRLKIYTQADGLPGGFVRACGRDGNGNLWFIQKDKLARLAPKTEEKTEPPPVFIGDLRAGGETVKKLSELGETSVENLDFTSEQRQIQIDFFALGFSTGETLSYQYKLEGADWSAPNSLRTVNLNLSPGSYNFSVRAVNAEGAASERPARVSFSIARPFWQRWWFLLLATLVFSGVIYALYRYRLTRLLELERVRTRIATDLHDDIGSSLSQIAILSEVVRQKVGAGGANEPLNLIANTSREMVDSMSDIVWAINPQKDHLSDLTLRMRRFASDVLDAKDISYRFHLAEKSNDVALGADIRREVYLIFKECLNNLMKYSDATEVNLSVEVENNSLVVSVKDNGKGFDIKEKSNGNADGFGGNGLINMRRRAENLGGKFEIESEKGVGTNVNIRIPVVGKLRQNRLR